MGWFDKQIRQRVQADTMQVQDAFAKLAGAVTLKEYPDSSASDSEKQNENAIREVLQYYHVRYHEQPDTLEKLQMVGVMNRKVTLTGTWYQDGIGAMLAKTSTGEAVALIPHGYRGYSYRCPKTGRRITINRKNAEEIQPEAICLYRPLGGTQITFREFLRFLFSTISPGDLVAAFAMILLLASVTVVVPYASYLLFQQLIPNGNQEVLPALFAMLFGVCVAKACFQITYQIMISKIKKKSEVMVTAGAMMRILAFPVPLFQTHRSGEWIAKMENLKEMTGIILDLFYTGLVTIVSLVICLVQLAIYGKALLLPILLLLVILSLILVAIGIRYAAFFGKRVEQKSELSGFLYAILTGVQKITLTGSQNRFFAQWAGQYSEIARKDYTPNVIFRIRTVLIPSFLLIGNLILYQYAAQTQMESADFFASFTIYGQMGTLLLTLGTLCFHAAVLPALRANTQMILENSPENGPQKHLVERLSGNIELSHITFRYQENQMTVLRDLSLKISRGEYVAIVGESGCGKSTLMNLMLGFITPMKGAVYYDGQDLRYLDGSSFRRKIGVVLQDGMLFQGDIFTNITIAKPEATMEEAWEAARLAGLEEDIKKMPMQMHTLVAEGNGGISGGQKQRILIARAILAKPRVLFLDEATSALDNITQRQVSEALASMKATRIVVAHRLSTIRQCNRIVYIHKGEIVEDGTYDELMQQEGYFARLVERQQLAKKAAITE